ncbi:hypothetical protein FRX31_028019 [Thalictrum thalictroides]|uniref:Uncharacterized protein n=1 Tax=Thalictrum thalictroides TaxID=46969 RepID=A0A7J6VBC4_THATH|nr:hypothetical protein FRX31_028019 [Thalictrum thalictroides]
MWKAPSIIQQDIEELVLRECICKQIISYLKLPLDMHWRYLKFLHRQMTLQLFRLIQHCPMSGKMNILSFISKLVQP